MILRPTNLSVSKPSGGIRLGVLGCGGIFKNIYSPILQELADRITVTGACDLNSRNAQMACDTFPESTAYRSPEDLLQSPDVDAVMVLTSETANASMAALALTADVPVYLEKPPALNRHEFSALREAEDGSEAPLFVAFNRRHTPLLRGFTPPRALRRIEGRMERLGRHVPSFPYTALHLIDSLLYFLGTQPSEVCVDYARAKSSQWTLEGQWETGASCELTVIPDGEDHREYLVFEGEDEVVEIQFPNPESSFPTGLLKRSRKGSAPTEIYGDPHDALYEMGYAPAFRGFVEHIENKRLPSPPYQLATCESALAIMDAMTLRSAISLSFTKTAMISPQ